MNRALVRHSLIWICFSVTLVSAFWTMGFLYALWRGWLPDGGWETWYVLGLGASTGLTVMLVVSRFSRVFPGVEAELRETMLEIRRGNLSEHLRARRGGLSPEKHSYYGKFVEHIDRDLADLRILIEKIRSRREEWAPNPLLEERLESLTRLLEEEQSR